MTTYQTKPIKSGTRLRTDHNVFAGVIIGDLSSADTLQGDVVWIAPADGLEVKKNDKWLHVTHRNGEELAEKGWTAIIHKNVPICDNFREVNSPPPDSQPVQKFPESFVLTAPDGERAEYFFVRVLE